MTAVLDRAAIAARIPHQGAMCLLAAVAAWSARDIHCSAVGHADPGHPLREGGVLPAPVAIEYAAQAMALHAALCAEAAAMPGAAPGRGFLASARQVVLHVPRLDTAPGPLVIRAALAAGDARQALYRFTVHDAAGCLLVEGRAAVVLDAT